jgi:hypothetical protein
MALSKITTKSILDGTVATADLAANAVTTAKIGADVIVADDVADSVALGAGYYIGKDGTVSGNSSGRDNLFRVNLNATTGNVTIAANNNASTTGPLTIANGTTLTITNTGRLAII